VHNDTPTGCRKASTSVDAARLHSLLSYATDHRGLTLSDFSRARVDIEAALDKPLSSLQSRIARGEVALTSRVLGTDTGEISLERIRQWFGEERLPDDWKKSKEPVGIMNVHARVNEVEEMMKKVWLTIYTGPAFILLMDFPLFPGQEGLAIRNRILV